MGDKHRLMKRVRHVSAATCILSVTALWKSCHNSLQDRLLEPGERSLCPCYSQMTVIWKRCTSFFTCSCVKSYLRTLKHPVVCFCRG